MKNLSAPGAARTAGYPFRLSDGRTPRIAAFDLDDTLISGDSHVLWIAWLCEEGLADRRYLKTVERMIADYSEGRLDMPAFIREVTPAVAALPQARLEKLLAAFAAERIAPRVRPHAAAAVAAAKAAGIIPVVISATCTYIVQAVARLFGVPPEDAIGIDLARDAAGRLTGEIEGVPSFREGKVARLDQWIAAGNLLGRFGEAPAGAKDAFFITDSFNDLPLALHAGGAAVVNPDERLAAEAAARGWPVLSWHAPYAAEAADEAAAQRAIAAAADSQPALTRTEDGASGDPDDPDEE